MDGCLHGCGPPCSWADGLIIETHNDPQHALCDGAQSLTLPAFHDLMEDLRKIAPVVAASCNPFGRKEAEWEKGTIYMKSLEETTFAIIGLGLIGGSYAKALKNRNAHKIIGMDRNHIVSLMAKDEGYITDIADEDPSLLQGADIIICAMYPGAFVSFVKDHVKYFKKDVLLTDVMGIKGSIPDEIDRLLGPGKWILYRRIRWPDGKAKDTVKVPPGFSKEQIHCHQAERKSPGKCSLASCNRTSDWLRPGC